MDRVYINKIMSVWQQLSVCSKYGRLQEKRTEKDTVAWLYLLLLVRTSVTLNEVYNQQCKRENILRIMCCGR